MLILPDSADLGDKKLSPAEGLEKFKAENQRLVDQKRIPDQDVLEDVKAALGRRLDWQDVVRAIKAINPAIIIEDGGMPNAVAVRILRNGEKEYITGFYKQPMPEFSSVLVDEKGLPVREVRGWRTVLTALIQSKAVSFKQVKDAAIFGDANGKRGELWHRNLRNDK